MPENATSFPVLFPSGATTLAGRVHRRAGSLTERQPAVLVSGSWLTVKEQMADLYAAALAERGFTAITFDFAGWGQSGGVPRQVEQPSRKIADIIAVANFVSTWSLVRLTFDGLSAAAEIGVPCLFVHSDGCVFPESIETLRHRLRGPVEVVWSEGAQTDFYDQPDRVAFAVDAVGRHFTTTLGAPEAVPA
jgi:dienelactone hydrolase